MQMQMTHSHKVALTLTLLISAAVGLMGWKVRKLGYSFADILPVTQYEITYAFDFDGHQGDVRVRSFLPSSDARQSISEEHDASSGMHLTQVTAGPNRV